MARSFKPMADYVLVKAPDPERQTASGIIVPDTASAGKPQQGDVVEVGPGRRTESGELLPMYIKRGDQVLFGEYAGIELTIGNVKYLVIRQDDILLVAVEEATHAEDSIG